MTINLQRVWSRQPQSRVAISDRNALAQGISFAVNCGAGPADIIRGLMPSTAAMSPNTSPFGLAFRGGSSGGDLIYPYTPALESNAGALSVLSLFYPITLQTAAGSRRIASRINGSAGNWVLTQDGASSTGRVGMYVHNGTAYQGMSGATALSALTPYCVIGTCAPARVAVYLNGLLDGSNTYSGSMRAATTGLGIGTNASGTEDCDALHSLTVVWQRELSASECAELAENPWQIFQPLSLRRYFGPSAGGANNGSGTVSGTGSLEGTGYNVHSGDGDVTATGALAGTGYNLHYGNGAVSGTGTLAGEGLAPTGTSEGAGTVSGAGTFVGEGYALSSGTGDVTGEGLLVGAGDVAEPTASTGSGAGWNIDFTGIETRISEERADREDRRRSIQNIFRRATGQPLPDDKPAEAVAAEMLSAVKPAARKRMQTEIKAIAEINQALVRLEKQIEDADVAYIMAEERDIVWIVSEYV